MNAINMVIMVKIVKQSILKNTMKMIIKKIKMKKMQKKLIFKMYKTEKKLYVIDVLKEVIMQKNVKWRENYHVMIVVVTI